MVHCTEGIRARAGSCCGPRAFPQFFSLREEATWSAMIGEDAPVSRRPAATFRVGCRLAHRLHCRLAYPEPRGSRRAAVLAAPSNVASIVPKSWRALAGDRLSDCCALSCSFTGPIRARLHRRRPAVRSLRPGRGGKLNCQPLLGLGPSRRHLRKSFPRCLSPDPGRSHGALTCFFPYVVGLLPRRPSALGTSGRRCSSSPA